MVVGAADHRDRTDRFIHCAGWFVGVGAFYILSFLDMKFRYDKAKETMAVIAVGFSVLFLITRREGFFYVAVVAQLVALCSLWLSVRIDWLWMGLARVLGAVSNTLLLTVVFVFVVTPVGVIRRWRGKDRMTRIDGNATTNFVARDHLFTGKDMENTW